MERANVVHNKDAGVEQITNTKMKQELGGIEYPGLCVYIEARAHRNA